MGTYLDLLLNSIFVVAATLSTLLILTLLILSAVWAFTTMLRVFTPKPEIDTDTIDAQLLTLEEIMDEIEYGKPNSN